MLHWLTEGRDSRWWMLLALLLVAFSVPLIALDLPTPRGDDAAYKSPGAEWAQHGRLIVPGLSGLLTTSEQGFAHYPPLYSLVFGLWYRTWGFSLTSTLACSYLIHAFQCWLAGIASDRLLRTQASLSTTTRRGLVAGVVLGMFLNCAYFDRPEELGLCFVWIGYLRWGTVSTSSGLAGYAGWGALTGLAALVAPFAGFLGAILVTVRAAADALTNSTVSRRRSLLLAVGRGTVAGLISLALVAAWIGWVEWRTPGLLRDQLWEGNLAFSSKTHGLSFGQFAALFVRSLMFHPPYLPIALLGLSLVPMAWLRHELASRSAAALWTSVTLSLLAVGILRPSAYTYVGAALMLAAPLFALGVSRFVDTASAGLRRTAWIAIGLCVVVSGRDPALGIFYRSRLPPLETAAGSAQALRQQIGPGERVAVAPRHWHAFQGRNAWRDAFLAALRDDREIVRCQWLVLYPDVGRPPYLDHFECIGASSVSAPRDHTYAFTLWRRREEPTEVPSVASDP